MWQSLSDIHCNLAQSFQNADYSLLSADPLNSCSLILNSAQDNLHDLLFSTNPTEFPRHGPNGTSIENIFSTLFINESYKITLEYKCPHTTLCSVSNLTRTSHQLPSLLMLLSEINR